MEDIKDSQYFQGVKEAIKEIEESGFFLGISKVETDLVIDHLLLGIINKIIGRK